MEQKYEEEISEANQLIELGTINNDRIEEPTAIIEETCDVHDTNYSSIDIQQHDDEDKVKDNNSILYHSIDLREMDTLFHADDFVEVKIDDYDNCGLSLAHCNAMKRLRHLLKYYKHLTANNVSKDDKSIAKIYEYLKTVSNNYEIANVMDDWHHVKKTHLQNSLNINFFDKFKELKCLNKNKCICLNRYKRDRNKEVYDIHKSIDHKNRMLMDQLDSIHSYVFHTSSCRFHGMQNQYFVPFNEHTTNNKPKCLEDCTTNQIIFIINNNNLFE
eukprot:206607_1